MMKKKTLLFRLLLLSLVVHLAVVALLPRDGGLVESVFARGVYPILAPVLAFAFGLVPFSVVAVGLAGLGLWALGWPVVNLVRWRRGRLARLRDAWLRTGAGYLVVVALGFHTFFLDWGYNYLRPPLERRLGLPAATASPEAMTATARRAVSAAGASHAEVGAWDPDELERLLDQALARVHRELEGRELPFRGRIKAPIPRGLLAAFGSQGVISPWTLEAHVDPDLPPAWYAFAAAHEKAHLAGYAPERDANFVAWLALTTDGDARLRYAGHLGVVSWFVRGSGLASLLSGPVNRDLRALAEYHAARTAPALESASETVYRVYLKANRVEAGLADYGRVAELIHAWQASRRG
jgi:hypothetical protein